MIIWVIYLAIFYVVVHYGWPLLSVFLGYQRIKSELRRLDTSRYRVFKDVTLPDLPSHHLAGGRSASSADEKIHGRRADYVVVSVYGVFAFHVLNMRRGFSRLEGNEEERTWKHTVLPRFRLPFVGESLNDVTLIENPVQGVRNLLSGIGVKAGLVQCKDIMRPGVIIVPKLATVTLQRSTGSDLIITYPWLLGKVLNGYSKEVLTPAQVSTISDLIRERSQMLNPSEDAPKAVASHKKG